jgi:hypothetical protein
VIGAHESRVSLRLNLDAQLHSRALSENFQPKKHVKESTYRIIWISAEITLYAPMNVPAEPLKKRQMTGAVPGLYAWLTEEFCGAVP